MHNGDPHEIPEPKWSVRVLDAIAELEHVCNASFEFFERMSFRLFLLIYFMFDLVRHFKR
jgi:hypothetical protein